MCRQLTMITQNEYRQAILICEHDTIHLVNNHTTILLSRHAFYQLDGMLRSRCLMSGAKGVACKTTPEGEVELWIGNGAFRLQPVELFALSKLVDAAAIRLRTTPLDEIIGKTPPRRGMLNAAPPNPSLN